MAIMKVAAILSTLATILPALVAAAPTPTSPNTALYPRTPGSSNFLFPGGLGPPLNQGFADQPSATVTTYIAWVTYIPEQCKIEAQKDGGRCAMSEMEVIEVHYGDSDPAHYWMFCRCKTGAQVSLADLISLVGHVPPGLRQHARNFMAFGRSGGAYTYFGSGDVIFLGPVNPTIVFHEISHAADGGSRSSAPEYLDAIKKDTCWADYYAGTNNVEAWAQTNVVVRYKYGVAPLPTQYFGAGFTEACMANQIKVVHDQNTAEIVKGYDGNKAKKPDNKVLRLG